MSFRSLMIPVLLLGLLSACDNRTSANEQAAAPAPTAVSAKAPANAIDRSHKGAAAPADTFEDPAGKPTSIAAVVAAGGKPVLVNLWATWCGPCIKEMPTLDAAAAHVAVLPIAQDKDRATVSAFFAARKFARLQPYLDSKVALSIAYEASLPMSILYDASGHEVWRSTGGMDWTSPAAKALLAEAK